MRCFQSCTTTRRRLKLQLHATCTLIMCQRVDAGADFPFSTKNNNWATVRTFPTCSRINRVLALLVNGANVTTRTSA